MFCFPCAGGGASAYRLWADLLPDSIELCAVQLPGRENRLNETPHRRIEGLISALADALEPQLERSYALFGHSMGALIAFELAHCLRRNRCAPPVQLFAASAPAPHLPRFRAFLHRLPDAALVVSLRRLGGMPEWVVNEPELLALVLPTFRADLELWESYAYHPRPPLPYPISVFGGAADTTVKPFELAGWAQHTKQRFAMRFFSGTHFFVASEPHALIDAISSALLTIPR